MEKSISTWSRAAHVSRFTAKPTPAESMVATYHVGLGKKRTTNLTVYGSMSLNEVKNFLAIQSGCHAIWINRLKVRPFTDLEGIGADYDGDDYDTATMPYNYEASCVVSWFPFERKSRKYGSTRPMSADRLKQSLSDSLGIPVENYGGLNMTILRFDPPPIDVGATKVPTTPRGIITGATIRKMDYAEFAPTSGLVIHKQWIDQSLHAYFLENIDWTPYGRPDGRQHWVGGLPYEFSGRVHHPKPWNPTVNDIMGLLNYEFGFEFNTCYANLYPNRKIGLGYHQDTEPQLDASHPVASVSFGVARVFALKRVRFAESGVSNAITEKVSLENRDLAIMYPDVLRDYKHAILPDKQEGSRISLTFRKMRGLEDI